MLAEVAMSEQIISEISVTIIKYSRYMGYSRYSHICSILSITFFPKILQELFPTCLHNEVHSP